MAVPAATADAAGVFVADVCDMAPGLNAPLGAPVPLAPDGLSEGAFVADIGDCALAVVVCPPLANN